MTYSDHDIDEALDRIGVDVMRRYEQPEFHGPAMAVLLEELRRMEAARRAGQAAAALALAAEARAALEKYRPTNATSRSKAILSEIVAELLLEAPEAG
jgi:hypothetical protein